MKTRKDLLRMIRRSQTLISIILFFSVFLFCWKVTSFEITEIQLSKWGADSSTSILWNSIICLLSVSIFINSVFYINNNARIKKKRLSYFLFGFISLCLFLVGIFNINYELIHNLAAYLYFFAYPLVIFLFTYINRKSLKYSDWIKDISISVSMIIIPLIFIAIFNGMAIAEIVHTLLVCTWNIKLALKND